jgi:hypothetical protein
MARTMWTEGAGSKWPRSTSEDKAGRWPNEQSEAKIKGKARCVDVRANIFSVRAVEEWNDIPANLKMATTVGQFQRLYKNLRENRPWQ